MSEDNKDGKKVEGSEPNPSTGDVTKPEGAEGKANPTDPKVQEQLNTANEKIDELKRQYKGSSDEALRLKTDLDSAATKLSELESKFDLASAQPITDDGLQDVVEKEGLVAAIAKATEGIMKPLQDKVNRLVNKEVDLVLSDFKTRHPGLKDDILTKFDTEFDRLKSAYPTVEEAMEAAFKVIGGSEADVEANKGKKTEELIDKSNSDTETATKNVSEDGSDRSTPPVNTQAEVQTQIARLTGDAVQLEAENRDASLIWAQVEELRVKAASNNV